jgi:hypothetical protein
MEKGDIIAGLKQALSRGDPLEKAKQSFINAGYSKKDVEDSANSLDNSVLSMTSIPSINLKSNKRLGDDLPITPQYRKEGNDKILPQGNRNLPEIPIPSNNPKDNKLGEEKKPRSKLGKILGFVIVILLVILGFSLFYLNK